MIGWDREATAQIEGLADFPDGRELERIRDVYFQAYPDGRDRLAWPGITHVRVRPRWIRYSDFAQQPAFDLRIRGGPPRMTGTTARSAILVRLGLSILSGVLLFLAVPGFDLWPLMFVAMVPQLWVARAAATPRRAFLYGWLTGTIANAGGFYWMDGLLEKFGHMPAVEALPIMLLLVAYQGLAFALLSWLVRRAVDLTGRPLALLAPLVMVTIELLVPQIFPYYLAIAVAFVPRLIQVADLTGPLGVTALLLAFNGALADLVRDRRAWRGLAVAGALLVADVGYGTVRLHQADARRAAAPKVRTGLVQANVGILEKWDPAEFARLLQLHQQASAELTRGGAQLIVWPESSYPYALPRDFAHDFPHGRRAPDPPRVRHAAAVRRAHRRRPLRPPRRGQVPVQHGADDGRGRRHHAGSSTRSS